MRTRIYIIRTDNIVQTYIDERVRSVCALVYMVGGMDRVTPAGVMLLQMTLATVVREVRPI